MNIFAYANEYGRNGAFANGTNAWVDGKSVTDQRWLKLAEGVHAEQVAANSNELLTVDHHGASCLPGLIADQISR